MTKFKPYPKYKDSGIPWIGEIPEGWNRLALKRLTEIKITDGPHETPSFLDEGIPFVSAEAIQDGKINFEAIRGFIDSETNELYSKKCKPKRGDLFLVKSGSTTGKIAIVDVDCEFNIWSPIALIRLRQNIANNKYAFFFLQSEVFQKQVQSFWSFGTQPNIGMGVIENLFLAVPPVSEQKAIAEFLDRETSKIDELIGKKEKLIELLKEKRQARISHTVTKGLDPKVKYKDSDIPWIGEIPEGWGIGKIIYYSKLLTGGTPDKSILDYWENGTINWMSSGEVNKKEVYEVDNKITEKGYKNSNVSLLPIHSVMIALNGQGKTKGTVAVLKVETTCNQSLAAFICDNKNLYFKFLFYFLESRYKQLRGLVGDDQREGLSLSLLKTLLIGLPPLSEQKAIAEFLDRETAKIDELIEKVKTSIGLAREQRQALISAAVTGKVDVRGV
jgi:type I restriction enzyme S subunit